MKGKETIINNSEYINKKEETKYKKRAFEVAEIVKGKVELNNEDKVWKVSTFMPINFDYVAKFNIHLYKEVVAFEIILPVLEWMDNDIFNKTVSEYAKNEFRILDKYNSRLLVDNENKCMILNVAYVYSDNKEDDDYYDINNVADILIYLGRTLQQKIGAFQTV